MALLSNFNLFITLIKGGINIGIYAIWTGIKFCEKHPNIAIIIKITNFLPFTTEATFLEIILATPVFPIATARVPKRI